jgi:4-nitrophenyl phosphatase
MKVPGIEAIRKLIVDMDGVLWRGEEPMPGLKPFFLALNRKGIDFVLCTNNASRSATQFVAKLSQFGVDVPASRVLGSAEATAEFLASRFPPGSTVHVIGEAGLRLALEAVGFRLLAVDGYIGHGVQVEAVVVGLDRETGYQDLANASILIARGAAFIGANPDVTLPSEYGQLPGTGSILAFLTAATGKKPAIVGKPSRIMFDQALTRLGGTSADTVMIGDRLSTDIEGAKSAGLRAALLMSGVTDEQELADSHVVPDWVFDGLPELTAFLERLPEAAATEVD